MTPPGPPRRRATHAAPGSGPTKRLGGSVTPGQLGALALATAALTAAAEISWHAAATGVDGRRLLAAHLDIAYGLRPAWWVLIAGAAAAWREHGACPAGPRRRGLHAPAGCGGAVGRAEPKRLYSVSWCKRHKESAMILPQMEIKASRDFSREFAKSGRICLFSGYRSG
jgi:hypothetical protein